MRRYRDIKLVATKRRKKLLSYYKVFQMKYISNRNEKKKKKKKNTNELACLFRLICIRPE